jgi:phasin family protein
MTEMGKTSYSAMQELAAINSKAFKELSELQLGLATYSMESGVELTKTLTTTTNYKDAVSAEVDFANEYSAKVIEFGNKSAEILTDSRDEVVSWFEKAVEEATAEVTPAPAPKKTTKKAAA